jgi:protein tyrosine phosphatase (PTP) superfamily phosphohydrolase (DUF442 family)
MNLVFKRLYQPSESDVWFCSAVKPELPASCPANVIKSQKFIFTVIAIAAALVVVILVGRTALLSESKAPAAKGSSPGAANNGALETTLPAFRRVDDNYSRGAEPVSGGIGSLVDLGVKTIVDLRSKYDRTDDIKIAADRVGLRYEWVPMSVWDPPTHEEASHFIEVVTQNSQGPFFVFCTDGLHRTGEMTAIYRVARSGWSVEQALKEMDEIGFNPYYYSLRNYVWDYARKYRPDAVPAGARRNWPAS